MWSELEDGHAVCIILLKQRQLKTKKVLIQEEENSN